MRLPRDRESEGEPRGVGGKPRECGTVEIKGRD